MTKEKLLDILWAVWHHEVFPESAITAAEAYSSSSNDGNANVMRSLPPKIYEIDFDGNVKAKLEVDEGVKVLAAMNGYGYKIPVENIVVTGGNAV